MNESYPFEKYPFHLALPPHGEGEGWLVTFPDLPGCIADGATEEEAIANAREAFVAWMTSAVADQVPIPAPHSGPAQDSGRSDAFSVEQRDRIRANFRARGMTIEVFLPESLADWLREKLAAGVYANAGEAAYLAFQELRELDRHPQVRRALLTAMLEDGLKEADSGQTYSIDEVRAHIRAIQRKYADIEPPSK